MPRISIRRRRKKLEKEVQKYYEEFYRPAIILTTNGVLTWSELDRIDREEFFKIVTAYAKYVEEVENGKP